MHASGLKCLFGAIISARGSPVPGVRATEPKTKVPGAGVVHKESAECREEQ